MRLAVVASLLCAAGCSDEEFFITTNAELLSQSLVEGSADPLAGHHVHEGKNLVVGVRKFSGLPLLTDSGEYEKISAVIPNQDTLDTKSEVPLEFDGVFVFWSEGYSSAPKAAFCLGHTLEGKVWIDFSKGANPKITIKAPRVTAGHKARECSSDAIDISAEFRWKDVASLTPWEGRASDTDLHEAYP